MASTSLRPRLLLGLLLLGAASLLSAQAFASLLSPHPELKRIGALEEPLPLAELERAALLASLIPPASSSAAPGAAASSPPTLGAASLGAAAPPPGLEGYSARLGALLEGLAAETAGIPEPRARAEAALLRLHEDGILKTYVAQSTSLAEILDSGRYNCVSSAVLYLLVLKRLGIEAAGVRTLDHAFVLVRVGGREIDVETTSPYGFDPGVKKEFTDAFGKVTGFSYVPPGSYGQRWTIGERALVALILSNRSAFLDEGGRYAEALSLGASLEALMADREGRDFLLDRVNNLAALLGERRDFAAAEALVLTAKSLLGAEPRLEALLSLTSYNRAASFAEARKWKEALETAAALVASGRGSPELRELAFASLGNLVGERIAARDYGGGRAAVEGARGLVGEARARLLLSRLAEAELAEAVQSRPYREALALVEEARRSALLENRRLAEFLVFLYGREAGRIGSAGDWLGAAALAEEGAAKAGRNESLLRAAATFRRNFAAEAHNRFAALFNARRYAEAQAELEAALRLLPGEPSLAEDLALVKKTRLERP